MANGFDGRGGERVALSGEHTHLVSFFLLLLIQMKSFFAGQMITL